MTPAPVLTGVLTIVGKDDYMVTPITKVILKIAIAVLYGLLCYLVGRDGWTSTDLALLMLIAGLLSALWLRPTLVFASSRSHLRQKQMSNRPMKIAIVILEFPALNETFILDHITGLIDRGHEVDIYAMAPKGEPKEHAEIDRYALLSRTVYRDSTKFMLPENRLPRILYGIPLFARGLLTNPRGTLNSLNVSRFGKRALSLTVLFEVAPFVTRSGGYDIVHCHFPENGELAVHMRDIGAITGKIVTQFHSYHLPFFKPGYFPDGRADHLFPNLFKEGDLFLTSGEHSKRFFDNAGWGREKMIIHRYSVPVGLFDASNPGLNDDGQVRLLSVGRLVQKKGFKYSIQGVANILQRFPNVRYDIAGDGPLRSSLERLIADLGVANNIRLLGFQTREEILQLLKRANIFLAPCVTSDGTEDGRWEDAETGPIVVLEAMASGIPVISTRHAGIPEFLHDDESGFLLEERDVDGIADRLTHLLMHPEIWQEMGQKGRKHVEKYHSLDKQNDRLVEIYRHLLEGDSQSQRADNQTTLEYQKGQSYVS